MSRIGRLPIAVPAGVDVTIDGRNVTVSGPKGSLSRELHPEMLAYVLRRLASSALLIVAMVAVIAVHAVGLRRAWEWLNRSV